MKKFIPAVLILLSVLSCNSDYVYYDELYDGLKIVSGKNSKYGYANKSNEIIIKCKFDQAQNFTNGYAFVYKRGKWGVIDKNGEVVIPLKYSEPKYINDSLIVISDNNLWGGFNLDGEQVIPFIYEDIQEFSRDYAVVTFNGLKGCINKSGDEIIKCNYYSIDGFLQRYALAQSAETHYSENGEPYHLYGILSLDGNIVVDFAFNDITGISEGYAVCLSDYGWWFEPLPGFERIPNDFFVDAGYLIGEYSGCSKLRMLSEGIAAFSWRKFDDLENSGEEKWGFLNIKGEEIVPCIYDDVGDFHNGFAWVKTNNRYEYIDTKGNPLEIRNPMLDSYGIEYAGNFTEDYAFVSFQGEKYPYKLFPDGTCEIIMSETEKEREREREEAERIRMIKVTPPDNEIWYRTESGEKIEPFLPAATGGYKNGLTVYLDCSHTYNSENDVYSFTYSGPVKNIGTNRAFYLMESVSFPSSFSIIKGYGYQGYSNTNLKYITMPSGGIHLIDNYAFAYSTSLKIVEIPESCNIIKIGIEAFKECCSLESITLPPTVKEIGAKAFSGCSRLRNISIPNDVKELNSVFEYCSNLMYVELPDKLESLTYTFEGCKSLSKVNIPENVSFMLGTFKDCSSLRSIDLPSNLSKLIEAFDGCISLGGNIKIPSSVKYIGDNTFRRCERLTSVEIPSSVTEICAEAFYGCKSLRSIHLKSTVPPKLGKNAFLLCPAYFYVPSASVEAYKSSESWSSYIDRIIGY